MVNRSFSTEELIGRWEDLRDIKNTLGRMLNAIQLNRDLAAFDFFWSKEREDISLGLNEGFYRGRDAVSGFFHTCFERNRMISLLLQKKLPDELEGKKEEEIYGIGEQRYLPSSSPLIEIAGDGKTAKGLWTLLGNSSKVTESGPASYWTWGYYAIDFIREECEWKIWHMLYLMDIYHLCGQNWALPEIPLPVLDGFEKLKDIPYPEYTEKISLREFYSPTRRFTHTPRIPVPYETFSDTFSYGDKEGAVHE